MINPLIIKDKVCSSDAKGLIGSTGWLFAWLGDATDCRCCLGMRIALGLIVGGVVGYLIGVYPIVGLTAMCAILMTMAVMFSIWMMVQEQNKRDEQDDDEWLALAMNNGCDNGYDKYHDELNQLYVELDERGINLSEDDRAWVADKHLTLRTQYGNNIPFGVIADNIAGSLVGAVNLLKSAREIDADNVPTHEANGQATKIEVVMSKIISRIKDITDDKHGLPISLKPVIEKNYKDEGVELAGINDTDAFVAKQAEMALGYIKHRESERNIKNQLLARGLILDADDDSWVERRYEAIDDEYNGNILDEEIADILYEEYQRLKDLPPAPTASEKYPLIKKGAEDRLAELQESSKPVKATVDNLDESDLEYIQSYNVALGYDKDQRLNDETTVELADSNRHGVTIDEYIEHDKKRLSKKRFG